METIADVLAYNIRERAKVVPEGEWINTQQVFITRLKEQRYPTRPNSMRLLRSTRSPFAPVPMPRSTRLALKENGIDAAFAAAHADQVLVDAPRRADRAAAQGRSILKTKPSSIEKKPSQEQRDAVLVNC